MSSPYDIIERLIDKWSLADVLLLIGDICRDKSDHISASYQDEPLALRWSRAGTIVNRAVRELPKVPGIK